MLRGIRSRVLDVLDVKADTMLRFTILHRQIYGYWKVARGSMSQIKPLKRVGVYD